MRAMFLLTKRGILCSACLAVFRSAASFRRKRISSAERSSSESTERPRRLIDMLGSFSERVSGDGAGHAMAAAAPAAELGALDGDHLDTRAAQQRVGVDIAVVA